MTRREGPAGRAAPTCERFLIVFDLSCDAVEAGCYQPIYETRIARGKGATRGWIGSVRYHVCAEEDKGNEALKVPQSHSRESVATLLWEWDNGQCAANGELTAHCPLVLRGCDGALK